MRRGLCSRTTAWPENEAVFGNETEAATMPQLAKGEGEGEGNLQQRIPLPGNCCPETEH